MNFFSAFTHDCLVVSAKLKSLQKQHSFVPSMPLPAFCDALTGVVAMLANNVSKVATSAAFLCICDKMVVVFFIMCYSFLYNSNYGNRRIILKSAMAKSLWFHMALVLVYSRFARWGRISFPCCVIAYRRLPAWAVFRGHRLLPWCGPRCKHGWLVLCSTCADAPICRRNQS